MKKSETIEINEKQFTITELTVKQIIGIANNGQTEKSLAILSDNNETSISSIFSTVFGEIRELITICCDFSMEDLEELAPSEIKLLYEVFQRVNSDFLLVLREAGIIATLSNIKDRMIEGFSKQLAD